MIFEQMQARGHEQVAFMQHPPSGLRAVLAVHSRVLGPAVAACRMRAYEDEAEATEAALRLSEAMTLKTALAGMNYGGGACVLLAPEDGRAREGHHREALFRALGRKVAAWGQLVLTEDVGVEPGDIAYVAQETTAAVGMNVNTPVVTAYGVYRAMKAAAQVYLGSESLRGVRVAVQGVGAVGSVLTEHLHREGARVTVADIQPARAGELAEEFEGVEAVPLPELLNVPCDVFAPCGFGMSLRHADIPRLQARLIVGSEHSPIAAGYEPLLREAGIVYLPDYVSNAAGLIAAARGVGAEEAAAQVHDTAARICKLAARQGRLPGEIARELAQERITLIGSIG